MAVHSREGATNAPRTKGTEQVIYRIEDTNDRVNTDKARQAWTPGPFGNERYWAHLLQSSKGRYYRVDFSLYQNEAPTAEWVTDREAAEWLLDQDLELPADLAHLLEEIAE